MRGTLLVIVVVAACDGGAGVTPDAAGTEDALCLQTTYCNLIDQVGCNSDQRCTFVRDDDGGLVEECGAPVPTCVPLAAAPVPVGEPCAVDADGLDACVRGAFCADDGACRALCVVSPDRCAPADGACEPLAGSSMVGVCVP